MRTPQLLCSLLLLALAATACTRAESDASAQRAGEQVRAVAAKTGEQLADSWLTTKIQAQYFADDDIKAHQINVSTRDGIVTLTGLVGGQPERELAVQIAKTTDGVRQVNDKLTIAGQAQESGAVATTGGAVPPAGAGSPAGAASGEQPPGPDVRQTFDDASVTARVQSKFFADDRVKGRRIDVDTRQGVVTLSGEVASEDERAQALLLARETEGVRRVEDHLTIGVAGTPERAAPPADSAPAGSVLPGGVPPGTVPPATGPPAGVAGAPAGATQSPAIEDATLTTTIQAKYFLEPTVKASTIDVSARNGVVTLSGTVPSEAARAQALAIVRDTNGVVQVVDRLTVARRRR